MNGKKNIIMSVLSAALIWLFVFSLAFCAQKEQPADNEAAEATAAVIVDDLDNAAGVENSAEADSDAGVIGAAIAAGGEDTASTPGPAAENGQGSAEPQSLDTQSPDSSEKIAAEQESGEESTAIYGINIDGINDVENNDKESAEAIPAGIEEPGGETDTSANVAGKVAALAANQILVQLEETAAGARLNGFFAVSSRMRNHTENIEGYRWDENSGSFPTGLANLQWLNKEASGTVGGREINHNDIDYPQYRYLAAYLRLRPMAADRFYRGVWEIRDSREVFERSGQRYDYRFVSPETGGRKFADSVFANRLSGIDNPGMAYFRLPARVAVDAGAPQHVTLIIQADAIATDWQNALADYFGAELDAVLIGADLIGALSGLVSPSGSAPRSITLLAVPSDAAEFFNYYGGGGDTAAAVERANRSVYTERLKHYSYQPVPPAAGGWLRADVSGR